MTQVKNSITSRRMLHVYVELEISHRRICFAISATVKNNGMFRQIRSNQPYFLTEILNIKIQ